MTDLLHGIPIDSWRTRKAPSACVGLRSARDAKRPTTLDRAFTALTGPIMIVAAGWYVFSQAFGS